MPETMTMTDPVADLFKDKDYCCKQIAEARKIFGDTRTTEVQYDAMEKVLAMMYLNCPADLQSAVYGTLHEATIRKSFYITRWAKLP